MFLVLNRTQALCPKIIPTDEGSRIVVSQELNTPSIVWALGGHRFENLLLKGEVSTICSDNVSKHKNNPFVILRWYHYASHRLKGNIRL